MARQRFIHPSIWKDPVFGRMQPLEQVMFIGMFSIADDEGRLLADPAYLRAEIYPYKDFTSRRVKTIRDAVVKQMENVHLYRAPDIEYIALLKWGDFQKPKYPTPSKIPAPFISARIPPALGEGSPNPSLELEPESRLLDPRVWVGSGLCLDWEGSDGLGLGDQDPQPSDPEIEEKIRARLRDVPEVA